MSDPSFPRIYTKTGDDGETGLYDGTRVLKTDPRIEATGDVDELSACLGLARAALGESDLCGFIEGIQRDLLAVGSRIADPRHRIAGRVTKAQIEDEHVRVLERQIDALESEVPPLRRFILAGGCAAGAHLHLARAVCRRAERRVVALGPAAVDRQVVIYLNRLSDLLFVMARAVNTRAGAAEIEW